MIGYNRSFGYSKKHNVIKAEIDGIHIDKNNKLVITYNLNDNNYYNRGVYNYNGEKYGTNNVKNRYKLKTDDLSDVSLVEPDHALIWVFKDYNYYIRVIYPKVIKIRIGDGSIQDFRIKYNVNDTINNNTNNTINNDNYNNNVAVRIRYKNDNDSFLDKIRGLIS